MPGMAHVSERPRRRSYIHDGLRQNHFFCPARNVAHQRVRSLVVCAPRLLV